MRYLLSLCLLALPVTAQTPSPDALVAAYERLDWHARDGAVCVPRAQEPYLDAIVIMLHRAARAVCA